MAAVADSKRAEPSALARMYLLFYNVAQTAGWILILMKVIQHSTDKSTKRTLWQEVDLLLCIFQTGAVLEVVHAAKKLVRSDPFLTGFQVASRLFLLWGVVVPCASGRLSVGFLPMVIAWSVTEIIRYGYYALNIVNYVPHLLLWCRYTLFIVLYPVGVSGELLCTYASLPHISSTGLFSVRLPNPLNFAFDYHTIVIAVMLGYIPIFPQLYLHMFGQRKKFLS